MTDLIYVAGKLNDDACGYIQNLARMLGKSRDIRLYTQAATLCPGNDFLEGVYCGTLDYQDYTMNSIVQLEHCDAVYVMKDSHKSKGVKAEIERALSRGIPVFHEEKLDPTNDAFLKFLNRPKIMAIVGESGTGKTTAAEYIERRFNIPMIRSYTDRPARGDDDTSHTFLTQYEFDKIDHKDMIVYTEFGENRYCCKHEDVAPVNSYVIDERGFMELKLSYKADYRIEGLRLRRARPRRVKAVGEERVERDKYNFVLPNYCFDYVYYNNGSLRKLEEQLNVIVELFNGEQ